MKQLLLLTLLPGLLACQLNTSVTPVSPTSDVVGTYQTNGFLDYRCLTLSSSQMPIVTIQQADDTTLTLTVRRVSPKASVEVLNGVTTLLQPDQSYELRQAGRVIGSVQTGRVFNASGMETQGRLLRLSSQTSAFVGYQP